MKATGIVRRIDDLGRVVIPKEIRRTLRIREGDPLEIYTEKDGGVIFRKYSPMGDLQEFAAQMCESIGSATGHIAAVTDRDSIIALYGIPKRELMDKPNSPELEKLMEQRKNYLYKNGDAPILAADGEEKCCCFWGKTTVPCRKRIRGWSRPLPVFWENRWRTSDDISQNAENVLAAFCCAKA